MMVKAGVLELIGYREWTESVGDDREWLLQKTQASLYASIQDAAARRGGFILPLRYDYMAVMASSLDDRDLEVVLSTAASNSPVPVRLSVACGSTPVEALNRAWSHLGDTPEGMMFYEACDEPEYTAVAHLDINNITEATRARGVVETYNTVMRVLAEMNSIAVANGALAQYLGGDNVLVVLPLKGWRSIVEKLVAVDNLKAGVGIAASPRRALTLAAKALHEIRVGKAAGPVYEIIELPAETR